MDLYSLAIDYLQEMCLYCIFSDSSLSFINQFSQFFFLIKKKKCLVVLVICLIFHALSSWKPFLHTVHQFQAPHLQSLEFHDYVCKRSLNIMSLFYVLLGVVFHLLQQMLLKVDIF